MEKLKLGLAAGVAAILAFGTAAVGKTVQPQQPPDDPPPEDADWTNEDDEPQ